MRILQTIKDGEIEKNFKERNAVRAVLFDSNRNIPLLFVSKYNYHKLPGGGIESGENKSEALIREVREEVGAQINIKEEIGKVVEIRSKFNLKQISYCYYGDVISVGRSHLEQSEIDEGFQLVWLRLDSAIKALQNDKPANYEGLFIQKRDLIVLKEVKSKVERTGI